MQKQNTKYTKTFLCIDIVLSIITLGYVAFVIYETNKYMYFAGFASLFMLLLLKPYFIILFQCVLLLLLSIILKKENTNDCCIDFANSLLFRMVIDSIFISFRYFVV